MALLHCDKCQTALPGAVVNTGALAACPGCGVPTLVQVFPAFGRPAPRGRTAEALASAEDAGCFYHPGKKAVVPCDDCGRFLCALCDLALTADRHVCPACAEAAGRAGPAGLRGGPYMLYDRLTLGIACLGLIPGVNVFVGPVALFLVVRFWNEPRRGVRARGPWRLGVAGALGLVETGFAVWMLHAFLEVLLWRR